MTPEQEVIEVLIDALESDIQAHEAGEFDAIAMRFDDVLRELLPFHSSSEIVTIALEFWDCWGDASCHEWRHYDGIESYDWPKLARDVVASLRSNRMPNNELITQHFTHKRTASWLGRLKSFLGSA